jgi:hypothetical protein
MRRIFAIGKHGMQKKKPVRRMKKALRLFHRLRAFSALSFVDKKDAESLRSAPKTKSQPNKVVVIWKRRSAPSG